MCGSKLKGPRGKGRKAFSENEQIVKLIKTSQFGSTYPIKGKDVANLLPRRGAVSTMVLFPDFLDLS